MGKASTDPEPTDESYRLIISNGDEESKVTVDRVEVRLTDTALEAFLEIPEEDRIDAVSEIQELMHLSASVASLAVLVPNKVLRGDVIQEIKGRLAGLTEIVADLLEFADEYPDSFDPANQEEEDRLPPLWFLR